MVDSIANTEARNQVGKALQEIEMADHGGELVFKVGDRVAVRSVLCGPVPRRRTDPRRRPLRGPSKLSRPHRLLASGCDSNGRSMALIIVWRATANSFVSSEDVSDQGKGLR